MSKLPFDPKELSALQLRLEKEQAKRIKENYMSTLFPDSGPLARDKYPKHMQFFREGARHQERAFMAANRVGKSLTGAYEMSCHATGLYPPWWEGRRFDSAVDAWASGDTNETTRDIIQRALLGSFLEQGTGMIPKRCLIGEASRRQGLAEAVDTIRVQHVSGGISAIGLKAYEAGRAKFQGTAKHVIWCDEEPPADVYDEMMLRLMTTDGIMMATFTPMRGLSEIALRFMPHLAPGEIESNPYV